MSISIGAGYELPEEQERTPDGRNDPERIAVVDDLNDKLQVGKVVDTHGLRLMTKSSRNACIGEWTTAATPKYILRYSLALHDLPESHG